MNRRLRNSALGLVAAISLTACGGDEAEVAELTGAVEIDGSSTVYPISAGVAEEFMAEHGDGVRITVAQSGTGGGFRRFCAGETDVSNASRPITETEVQACAAAGVEYVELKVALDGLAILVNPQNSFVECLTVAELKNIWMTGSTVQNWSQVRNGWPDEPIRLFGPGTNSGTFDYFTEAINGETGASRADYNASEDDNTLVQGVAGDANSLGYFGYAYYSENQALVKLVAVDNGQGCVAPSAQTVESGQYAPLSRPLYIYVKRAALERPEVREFVEFYLNVAATLASEVGYVPLHADEYESARTAIGQAPDA